MATYFCGKKFCRFRGKLISRMSENQAFYRNQFSRTRKFLIIEEHLFPQIGHAGITSDG